MRTLMRQAIVVAMVTAALTTAPATADAEAGGPGGGHVLPAADIITFTTELQASHDARVVTPQAQYFFQYVQNSYGGQCLDGDRNTIPVDGSRVQLWACNGYSNQNWRLS